MPKNRNASHDIDAYEHAGKTRLNNPPAGLVTQETDPDLSPKTYSYDPHLDPQLVWAGKAEHTSFDVPTVSLHVHERIDPRTIVEAVRKQPDPDEPVQLSLFAAPQENPPLRQAIEFYKHPHGWSNRLVAGDSLLVMNSLLEKEGLAGQVQIVYIDPPYGIKYGSNFQPFVNRRDVKDGKDEDLAQEPETLRAFRDTWELGIHSYVTYLRDRLLLARDLLSEAGSCFVQISDENVHHVRELMDEVFGVSNFVAQICYKTSIGLGAREIDRVYDFVVWYAKSKTTIKYRQLFLELVVGEEGATRYNYAEFPDGTIRRLSQDDLSDLSLGTNIRLFTDQGLTSRTGSETTTLPFQFEGEVHKPAVGGWRTSIEGLQKLAWAGRILKTGTAIRFKKYFDDFGLLALTNFWADVGGGIQSRADPKIYAVQTTNMVIQRCLLMTTDPGDLVLDITCGSGTTAYVAEQWGRRWITCDTSRVAIALAKQRLMTAVFDYYELAHSDEGVGSGFKYKTVPHVTLKSIANNPDIRVGMTRVEIAAAIARHASQETLYDQPFIDKSRMRVTGPFTVEAVPAPGVKPLDELLESGDGQEADASIARSGETLRQAEWRDELLRTGIRGKGGQNIRFTRIEPLPGTRWLHAEGETRPSAEGVSGFKEEGTAYAAQRVAISFGPEYAPLESRQVEAAIEEAQTLVPKPKLLIFAAFQFDPEASKDIDETHWPGVTLLKAQMNADLLTEDLKKKRASNESFWLIGQPDVEVAREEWIVDSDGRRIVSYDDFKQLSGLGSLAEIDGLSGTSVSTNRQTATTGNLRPGQPDASSGRVDPFEHRRRAIEELHRRVLAVSGRGQGIAGGARNPVAHYSSAAVPPAGGSRPATGNERRDRQNAQRPDQIAALQTLTFDHLPLATSHFFYISVNGFDYYNTKTGNLESGGADKIAMWLLDTDYDGRSLFPRQVFFPMAGDKDGWYRLGHSLQAEIDEDLIEAYRGTVSLPFAPGKHRRAAVKIVDDRGIESLKIVELT